jgi:hypothetical protein
MARNTTPVSPTSTGKQSRERRGVDPRQPLLTDMASARMYGACTPQKGKCVEPGEKKS